MTTLSRHDDDALFELGLSELRAEEGTSEQASALEQRLLDTLGPLALAAPVVSSRRSFWAWATKPAIVLLGSVALIGVGMSLAHDAHDGHDAHEAPSAPAPIRAPAPVERAQPSVEPVLVVQVPAVEETPPAIKAPRAKAVRPARVDELTLMQRARDALRDDPKAALQIVEQHAREYPAGVFVQEREVLAINALLRQQRSADAHKRAERFVAAHEGSPYAVKLRAMLAQAIERREP